MDRYEHAFLWRCVFLNTDLLFAFWWGEKVKLKLKCCQLVFLAGNNPAGKGGWGSPLDSIDPKGCLDSGDPNYDSTEVSPDFAPVGPEVVIRALKTYL